MGSGAGGVYVGLETRGGQTVAVTVVPGSMPCQYKNLKRKSKDVPVTVPVVPGSLSVRVTVTVVPGPVVVSSAKHIRGSIR